MKNRNLFFIIFITLVISNISLLAANVQQKGVVYSCDYMGYIEPTDTPLLFAKGIISSTEDEYAFDISSSGNEILISRGSGIYIFSYNEQTKKWSYATKPDFNTLDEDGEASFSPDGQKVYFNSRRPCAASNQGTNIWVAKRNKNSWDQAEYTGLSINGKAVHAVSVAANGNVYTDGVLKFVYQNGKYSAPQRLSSKINGSHVFISPDESYIIYDNRIAYKKYLFIAFSKGDGSWTDPIKLSDKINSTGNQGSPFVTADGKFLFFNRRYEIYWVKADFIEELRPKN